MSQDLAIACILGLAASTVWASLKNLKQTDAIYRRLYLMMSDPQREAEKMEFLAEYDAWEKKKKRLLIVGIVIVAVLAVGWFFLMH
jgi:hypothetical protein